MENLLFSSDVGDHYKSVDDLIEEYISAMDFSAEEISSMTNDELEDLALEWADNWIAYDAQESMQTILEALDQNYDSFKVHLNLGTWRGTTRKMMTVEEIKDFVNDMKRNYRSLDDVAAYLMNGRVVIEFRHHDATDSIEIMALENGRPTRITRENAGL